MFTLKKYLGNMHMKFQIRTTLLGVGFAMSILIVILSCLWIYHTWNKPLLLNADQYLDTPLEINIPIKYILTLEDGLQITERENMIVTCYTNRIEETDSSPNQTATGRIVYEGSCAISQDIFGPVIAKK